MAKSLQKTKPDNLESYVADMDEIVPPSIPIKTIPNKVHQPQLPLADAETNEYQTQLPQQTNQLQLQLPIAGAAQNGSQTQLALLTQHVNQLQAQVNGHQTQLPQQTNQLQLQLPIAGAAQNEDQTQLALLTQHVNQLQAQVNGYQTQLPQQFNLPVNYMVGANSTSYVNMLQSQLLMMKQDAVNNLHFYEKKQHAERDMALTMQSMMFNKYY